MCYLGLENVLTEHRLDLLGAAFHDVEPRFALPAEVDQEALKFEYHTPSPLPGLLERLEKISVEFVPVTEAIALMSMVAGTINSNSNQPAFWESDINAVKIIGPASHHLLSMPRVRQNNKLPCHSPESIVVELTRLSCLTLLAALKARFSLPALEISQLCDKFCKLIQHDRSDYPTDILELVLWSTITVALISSGEQRQSIVCTTRALMSRMELVFGIEAIERAKQIIWIDDLASKDATNLAQEIDGYFLPEQLLT